MIAETHLYRTLSIKSCFLRSDALLLEKMSIYWWRKRETTSVREVFEVQSSLSSSNFNLLMNLIILGIIVISVVWFSIKSVGLRRFQYRIFSSHIDQKSWKIF